MGKGDKKTAATSSRAAELLAKSGSGRPQTGFGGFSGSTPVSGSGFAFGSKYISQVSPQSQDVPVPSGPTAIIPSDLDGELAQQLQRLTKRDATTRLKSLQTLRSVVATKSEDDMRCMLGPWSYYFSRLVMDSNRSVRAEACTVMGAVAAAAGRNLAPFIKSIYPHWFLAQHDESPEVVSAATSSLQSAFPGDKATEVVLFCRNEVIKLLSENASSSPQSLGDPKKESPEELQARHARVLAATCAAIAAIVKSAKLQDNVSGKAIEARKALLAGAQSLLESNVFLRSTIQSKESSVRRNAYALISSVCGTAPELLSSESTLSHLAPYAFGALGDKESGNHPSMWDMVLSLASTHTQAWSSVNLNKAVLPKLWSLLRHGCYGSAEGSYPAVLPLVSLLPTQALGCAGYQSLLNAVWDGLNSVTQGAAQQAAAGCFRECYLYAMIKAEAVAGEEGASVFCTELTHTALETKCLPSCFSPDGEISRSILVEVARKLAEHVEVEESRHWKLQLVIDTVGRAAGQATCLALEIPAGSLGAPRLPLIGSLLLLLKDAVSERDAVAAARPVMTAILPEVRSGGAAPEATALLASLVKAIPALNISSFGADSAGEMAAVRLQHSASFTSESILKRIIDEKQSGAALEASCDLIVSCLPQLPNAAEALADALTELNNKLGAKAAYSLLIHFVITAQRDEDLIAARSPALDELCCSLCLSAENLATESGLIGLVQQLVTGNGMVSLLSDAGQAEVLNNLASLVTTGGNDEAMVGALRGIERCVLSPALNSSDAVVMAARLQALRASFEVLAEEACAFAARVADKIGAWASDDDESDSSGEENHHSELYRVAQQVWAAPHSIAQLVTKATTQQQLEFVQSLASSISQTLASYTHEDSSQSIKACSAAAVCAHAALDVCGQSDGLRKMLLNSLRGSVIQPDFFLVLGENIGFESLLFGFGDAEVGAILACDLLTRQAEKQQDGSADEKLTGCVVGYPNLLERVLSLLWEGGNSGAVGHLLSAALSSSRTSPSSSSAEVAVHFFRHNISEKLNIVDIGGSVNIKPVLEACVPLLRSSHAVLVASGLPQLSVRLCQSATTIQKSEGTDLAVQYAAACFPAHSVPPPIPRWASESDTASAVPLVAGTAVWYRHRDGNWEAGEVSTVDISIEPPSYGVKIATGVRETERGRLRVRNADEPPPLFVAAATESSAHVKDEEVHMIAEEEEKHALLDAFRVRCVGNSEGDHEQAKGAQYGNQEMPLLLHSAVAWCFKDFTQADWEACLSCLARDMEAVAQGVSSVAATIAKRITLEAEVVAGAPLGNPEASLAFFRRLHHKGVLHSSDKGAAAGAAIADALISALDSFQLSHGSALVALLQAYCHCARAIPTARTCPFMVWESSQAAVCAAALDAFISLGKIVALGVGCGQGTAAMEALHRSDALACWSELSVVVDATVAAADRNFLKAVVDRSNARIACDGVGCTDALVALALDPGTPHAARDAAYRSILLHSELISDLVRGGSTGDEDDSSFVDDSSPASDWCEDLERSGLVSDVAIAASDPLHPSFLTAWGLLIAHLLNSPESKTARGSLVERIKDAHGLMHAVLDAVLPLLPFTPSYGASGSASRRNSGRGLNNVAVFGAEDTSARGFATRLCALGVVEDNDDAIRAHAALVYAGTLRALPVPSRLWFGDIRDKSTASAVEKYTSAAVSAGLLAAEYAAVEEMASGLDRFEKFSVRANAASREVIASMEVEDGQMLDLVVKFPSAMPLRSPEAECRRSVGVSEARLRKWLLSITAFLRNRNGAVADALKLWKRNLDNEFEGHEDCLICYSIIHPSTGQVPRMACRTCRKRFHGACLYKWFHSSGKSNCPHCQSPW